MPYIAAIPAVGLLAGAAFGLLLPDIPHVIFYLALIASGALSVWAREHGHALADIDVHRPTLEDTYLKLTERPQ